MINLFLFYFLIIIGLMTSIRYYRYAQTHKNHFFIPVIFSLISFIIIFSHLAIAIPFENFSGIGTGRIGNGNGYFSDDLLIFNITSDRNIFITTENNQINIVEPISYGLGISSSPALIFKGDSSLQFGFIASDGFLYFTDSEGIKKRKTRDNTNPYLANDTGSAGQISLIYAGASGKLIQYLNNIYFFEGSTLKYFSLNDYIVSTAMTGISSNSMFDFIIIDKNGEFTVLTSKYDKSGSGSPCFSNGLVNYYLYSSNSSLKNNLILSYSTGIGMVDAGNFALSNPQNTIFSTSSYIYINYFITASWGSANCGYSNANSGAGNEIVIYKNYSIKSTNYYISAIRNTWSAISLGIFSTVTMYDYLSAKYDIFNFIEFAERTTSIPFELIYNLKLIESTQNTYAHNQNIGMIYSINVDLYNSELSFNEFLSKYDYTIEIIRPDGIIQDSADISTFQEKGLIFIEAEAKGGFTFYPTELLQNGTWNLRLYEINSSTLGKALLDTDSFIVISQNISTGKIGKKPFDEGIVDASEMAVSSWFWAGMIIALLAVGCAKAAGSAGFVGGFGIGVVIDALGGLIPTWAIFLLALIIIIMTAFVIAGAITKKE